MSPTGESAYHWRGGRYTDGEGYVRIYLPDHPNATSTGYVREHRLVMEETLERFLTADEVVHHINRDRGDNRIENLELLDKAEHGRLHGAEAHDSC